MFLSLLESVAFVLTLLFGEESTATIGPEAEPWG